MTQRLSPVAEFLEPRRLFAGSPVVVDNADALLTGPWQPKTTRMGYYGADYLEDGNANKGAASITWAPSLPQAGRYEVQIRYIAASGNADSVPVQVRTPGGVVSKTLNEKLAGSQWLSLGAYDFAAGRDAAKGAVVLSNAGTTGWVSADAVQFVPLPPAAPPVPASTEITLDNTQATLVGPWQGKTSRAGFYGADYLEDGNASKGAMSVTWTPTLTTAGKYRVDIRYIAASGMASNVPVTVASASGATTRALDERMGGSAWIPLGEYTFNAGSSGSVKLSNAGTTGWVSADAVRFTLLDAGPGTQEPVPSAPSALVVRDDATKPGYLKVQWADNCANETGFVLQRSKSADFNTATEISLPANTTTYEDTGLDQWTVYYYRVEARGSAGLSPFSNIEWNRTAEDADFGSTVVSSPTGTDAEGHPFWANPNGQSGLYYKVEVFYPPATGSATVILDSFHPYPQAITTNLDLSQGGQWQTLGTMYDPYVTLTAGTTSLSVRFTLVDMQGQILQPTLNTYTSDGVAYGSWQTVQDPSAIGGSYLSLHAPEGPDAPSYSGLELRPHDHYGMYDLYVRYHAAPANSSNVILSWDNSGTPSNTVSLDQTKNGDRWIYLGHLYYDFSDADARIFLNSYDQPTSAPLTFDAVMLRPISFYT